MTLYLEVKEGDSIKAYTYTDAITYDLIGPFFIVRRIHEDLLIRVDDIARAKVIHTNQTSH